MLVVYILGLSTLAVYSLAPLFLHLITITREAYILVLPILALPMLAPYS